MKKNIAILFFLLAAGAVIFLILRPAIKKTARPKITNFKACAAAGYRVMDSYPRQCAAPDGRIFVESFIEEKKP